MGFTVVGGLQFCWRDISAVLVEPSVVKPIDPLGSGVLDLIDGAPRTPMFDHLGLVQAVDRLRERIVPRRQLRSIRSVISELFG